MKTHSQGKLRQGRKILSKSVILIFFQSHLSWGKRADTKLKQNCQIYGHISLGNTLKSK